MSTIAVDTHVHLGAYADPAAEIDRAISAGIELVISTQTPSEHHRLAADLVLPPGVQLGLGFHPMDTGGPTESDELEMLTAAMPATRWVSEIGLDGFFAREGGPAMPAQRRVLDAVLELGVATRILSVHSREAELETLHAVRAAAPGAAVFHWYDGDPAKASAVVDAGYSFSVNSFMVNSPRHRPLLEWLPADRILLETDGPTTSMPDGTGCRPAHVVAICDLLADIRRVGREGLRAQVLDNYRRLEESVPTA